MPNLILFLTKRGAARFLFIQRRYANINCAAEGIPALRSAEMKTESVGIF